MTLEAAARAPLTFTCIDELIRYSFDYYYNARVINAYNYLMRAEARIDMAFSLHAR